MVREAEQHREEDRRRQELVEARNQADAAIYQAEKFLRDNKERVPDAGRQELERKIAATRSALQADVTASITSATRDLVDALQRVGASLYQAPPSGDGGQAAGGTPPPGEDVVDGEYREAGS